MSWDISFQEGRANTEKEPVCGKRTYYDGVGAGCGYKEGRKEAVMKEWEGCREGRCSGGCPLHVYVSA